MSTKGAMAPKCCGYQNMRRQLHLHFRNTKNSSLGCFILHHIHSLQKIVWFMIIHTPPFFKYQSSDYQKWIKVTTCQTDIILTLNCVTGQSGFSVLYGRYTIRCSKFVSSAHHADQVKCSFHYSQRFSQIF